MTWALAPPKPNELTPTTSVPSGLRAWLRVATLRLSSANGIRGLRFLMPMVAGTWRSVTQYSAFIKPATPDAASR
ncbi:hypothetical protein D3C84_647830 [compost metagenome]